MLVPISYAHYNAESFISLFRQAAALRAERNSHAHVIKDYILSPHTQEPLSGDKTHSKIKLLDGVRDGIEPRLAQVKGMLAMATMIAIHPMSYRFLCENNDGSVFTSDDHTVPGSAPHEMVAKFIKRAFSDAQKTQALVTVACSHPGYFDCRISEQAAVRFSGINAESGQLALKISEVIKSLPDQAAPNYAAKAGQSLASTFAVPIATKYEEIEAQLYAFNQTDIVCARATNQIVASITTCIGQHVPYTDTFMRRNPGVGHLIKKVLA